ncbi:MAG: type II toxin-antitoxin system PemK/MazF family toxin [Candidatus Bathyarchaeia archaeon]|nr:type II toxin-antitoxin system PemK/MazF family toxin [Candidatus Bathyarchaeia archaeon]
MKGKIVLIPFSFTNLTTTKLRPASVLLESEKDVVVAFISSRLPREHGPTLIVIDETHSEFKVTGLKVASVIRLDKVATISKELILGEIGEIGIKLKKEINKKQQKIFKSYTPAKTNFCRIPKSHLHAQRQRKICFDIVTSKTVTTSLIEA